MRATRMARIDDGQNLVIFLRKIPSSRSSSSPKPGVAALELREGGGLHLSLGIERRHPL